MSSPSVFVSGASGFIAQHIVKLLIETGYSVVGTVRSAEKGDQLKSLLHSDKFSYEIVKDIVPEGAFDEALKAHPEVSIFLHTASPFHFKSQDPENDLLIPAVNGTKNALKAIQAYGPQIKKVVVTSSVVAVTNFADPNKPLVVNETNWNPLTWEESKANPFVGYFGSKTFAEKAAWDFIKEQKVNFDLSTVNPVYVFGPQAFDESAKGTLNTSAEIINALLKLKPEDEVPGTGGSYIDVRDVAKAHLVAFEDKAINQRLILADGKFTSQYILDLIRKNFPELHDKLPVGTAATGEDANTTDKSIDNKKSRATLGYEFIHLEQTTVDTVKQILGNY